jgi:hypothetical protein
LLPIFSGQVAAIMEMPLAARWFATGWRWLRGLVTGAGAAVTAIALVGLAVALLACGIAAGVAAGPLTGRVAALREKSWSAAFQRQRDPDAAGRPRPRAPGPAPAAA